MFDSQAALNLPAYIRVLMANGQVEEMKLETYLAGAVAGQIGLSAPLEALKAQAVASRTYVAGARRHPEHNADVCIAAHCQKWKRVDPVSAPEVFRAVGETWGLVAMHDGALINAFFFEHCDGHTRNAEAMLLPAFPYLRGVDCSCGFLTLKGHGVGMCMRGAVVMARRGAAFEQILQHYYRGVQVVRIVTKDAPPEQEQTNPPRAPVEPARKRAAKKAGESKPKPESAARPALKSIVRPARKREPEKITPPVDAPVEPPKIETGAPVEPVPAESPKIEASVPAEPVPVESPKIEASVPAESAPVEVASEALVEEELPIAATEPTIETPAAAELSEAHRVAEADLPALEEEVRREPRSYHVDYLPGARMIAGCLERAGLPVMIDDPHGHQLLIFTGNAAHYGEGGFETLVDEDGVYRVQLDGQTIEVKVAGETAFIHAG